MTNSDILICGAGAAGLTLGIDLARRGASFRLIEKRATPFDGSRGKGVQPRSQEVFEDLGILDRLMATGGLYPPQRRYPADGNFTDVLMTDDANPTPAEPYHWALMVPQFLTEAVMRDRLAELGAAVEFGCELTGFTQDFNGVTAYLSGPAGQETVRVRYLVGADGGRSFVRHALDIGFPGKTLGVRVIGADVAVTGLNREVWHGWNEGDMDRQIGLGPLPGTDLFQFQAPIPLEGDADLSVKGLNAMLAQRSGRDDIRITAVHWASAFSMSARLADRYRDGRVFLCGDAAHVHPPTGGQGLNTSVQDAYNLGWKLAATLAGASDAVLASYEAERRPIAADVLGLSTRLLDDARRGEDKRGREVHQLDLNYRGGALALDTRGGALAAGDRAPDAPLTGAAGQPVRLFELFKGPHWTLLLGSDAHVPAARKGLSIHRVGGDILDTAGHLADAYALGPGEAILIRPDGYIGAVLTAGGAAALEGYLAGVGRPPGSGR
jgi:2-polyprenyl-6-methoxyphenol hydroxylase-like FAD-dependent oxidoreductase